MSHKTIKHLLIYYTQHCHYWKFINLVYIFFQPFHSFFVDLAEPVSRIPPNEIEYPALSFTLHGEGNKIRKHLKRQQADGQSQVTSALQGVYYKCSGGPYSQESPVPLSC